MALVLKINYTKYLDRARKSVRYHAFRAREVPLERKGIFDRHDDYVNVVAFNRSLDDPLTKERTLPNGQTIRPAVMHRLMFSLSRQEFERAGLTSWKPVVREALAAFERYHGIKLEWVAAEHQSRTHPHVHIDIKSVYTDAHGNRHRLNITQEMRQHLRWAVEGIIKRERERVWREEQRERAFERNLDRFVNQVTHAIVRGLGDAARDDLHEPDPLAQRRRKKRQEDRSEQNRER